MDVAHVAKARSVQQHSVVVVELAELKKWVPPDLFPEPKPLHLLNLLFDQLICQRLQRGYQIVLLPKEMIQAAIRKTIPERTMENMMRQCWLSFNHIYHRVVLVEMPGEQPYIKVQILLPKHSVKTEVININVRSNDYSYAFQVPDESDYMASRSTFKHHNLDQVNWSLLDTSLQMPKADFFREDLKVFSAKFLVVPDASKTVKEALARRKGDIFRRPSSSERVNFSFIKFLEMINRVRSNTTTGTDTPGGAKSHNTSALSSNTGSSSPRPTTPLQKQHFPPTEITAITSSIAVGTSGNQSESSLSRLDIQPISTVTPTIPSVTATTRLLKRDDVESILREWAALLERNPISLPPRHVHTLPPNVLISYDFIEWLLKHVEGLHEREEAIKLAEELLLAGRIEPLSLSSKVELEEGSDSSPKHLDEDGAFSSFRDFDGAPLREEQEGKRTGGFRYGLYFYAMTSNRTLHVKDPVERKFDMRGRVQVELAEPCVASTSSSANAVAVENEKECRFRTKAVSMEFPTSSSFNIRHKENMIIEWGRAFEITIKWFMSTGQTVADLVHKQWMRYAQKAGFHLFPVPEDAFAEPTNRMSSPLRCPIFVDLHTDCVPAEDFDQILRRIMVAFGFVLLKCPLHLDRNERKEERGSDEATHSRPTPQYVHLSGGMFVKYAPTQSSFMWSWNPMLSQRYRYSSCTEEFLDFMLKEFRAFCSNKDERLARFIHDSTVLREKTGDEPCHQDRSSTIDAIFGSPEYSLFQSNNVLSSI